MKKIFAALGFFAITGSFVAIAGIKPVATWRYTPSININFTDGDSSALTTDDDVGLTGYAVPGTSWNNFVVANNALFTTVKAIDANGAASVADGVRVSITGTRGPWSNFYLTAASNLCHSYIDDSPFFMTPTVTVTGIPYYIYRVIVYHSTDFSYSEFGYDIVNGTDYTYVDGVLTNGTNSWGNSQGVIKEGVDVLVSGELYGSTLTVVGHRDNSSARVRGCIAAIQIVDVTGIPEILSVYDGDTSCFPSYYEYSLCSDGPWQRDCSGLPIGSTNTVWIKYDSLNQEDAIITNLTIAIASKPSLSISSVVRSLPWDGTLAIDYAIGGDVNALDESKSSRLKVSAVDVTTAEEYEAHIEYLQGDIGVGSGSHSFVWRISDQTGVTDDSALWVTLSCEGVVRVIDSKPYNGIIATVEDKSDLYRTYEDEKCRVQYYIALGGKIGINALEYLSGDRLDLTCIDGLPVSEIAEGALVSVPNNVKVLFGAAPNGLAKSGLASDQIVYHSRYASTYAPSITILSSKIRAEDPTILDTVYRVDCALPTVKVRALAFEDGERSFAKVIRPETFVNDVDGNPTAQNIGDEIEANVPHTLSWKVSSDWATRLAKMKFEVLTSKGELLPLELRRIPASDQYGAMEFSWNTITDVPVFDALLWLYADKDPGLTLSNGVLRNSSTQLASGNRLSNPNAISYIFSKMGYSLLSGATLNYVKSETRLGLSLSGYKIVEDAQ